MAYICVIRKSVGHVGMVLNFEIRKSMRNVDIVLFGVIGNRMGNVVLVLIGVFRKIVWMIIWYIFV